MSVDHESAGGTTSTAGAPSLLRGRYLLEERIASGGMASVWRAHDEALGRTVAVKLLHEHLATDESFRERFRREAVSAAKLAHPGIVALYDTGRDGDQTFLVMEYVDGPTLRDVLADLGQLDIAHACGIVAQAARALAVAHRLGLVHRDIKPANILLTSDGAVKVADFGIAKLEAGQDLTGTGTVLGTAAYVSPEQVMGEATSPAMDQYALAVVLYELLCGVQPFRAGTPVATAAARLESDALPPRSVRADVPRALDAVVIKALERNPDNRFSDVTAFADALEPYADTSADATAALVAPVVGPANDGGDDTEPFMRSEGPWLGPVLVVLALAVALVTVGLLTGVIERPSGLPSVLELVPDGDGEESDPEPPTVATARLVPPAPVAWASYDPQGNDGVENEEQVPAVFDPGREATWRTVTYRRPDFGGLKDGVGFWIDLGRPHRLASVELATATPGIGYELRTADELSESIDGWEVAASVADSGEVELTDLTGTTSRYLLVWVTGPLQPGGDNGFIAEFYSIEVRGEPA